MTSKKYSLQFLADFLGVQLQGNPNCEITGIGSLDKAKAGEISFLTKASYRQYLTTTQASAVIVKKEHVGEHKNNFLIVADPYVAYAKISKLFDDAPQIVIGIHPTAIIAADCELGKNISIGPYCVIGNKVKLGDNVVIAAGCVINDATEIGANTKLFPKVILYHKVKIGQNCLIHSGVVIGSDGFGNANERGVWHKIYQLGAVVIGNNVEIGANTTIDRGAIADTIIEDGVRLDNQIQIGHNVHVGANTAIAGCVGIAGSTKIGRFCMIGGGVGINGHIEICDGVIITGMSAVSKSITESGVYSSGVPVTPHRSWWRTLTRMMQLEDIVQRLTKLEKESK